MIQSKPIIFDYVQDGRIYDKWLSRKVMQLQGVTQKHPIEETAP